MIEIEVSGKLPSERVKCGGYKETKVIWLSAEIMMFSNNEVPINEDIAEALDLIPELFRRSRIDQLVDKCSEGQRHRRHNGF